MVDFWLGTPFSIRPPLPVALVSLTLVNKLVKALCNNINKLKTQFYEKDRFSLSLKHDYGYDNNKRSNPRQHWEITNKKPVGDVIIQSGKTTFSAEKSVILAPGFEVKKGASFEAKIQK